MMLRATQHTHTAPTAALLHCDCCSPAAAPKHARKHPAIHLAFASIPAVLRALDYNQHVSNETLD
jgi:hypothetical protein